MIGDGYYVALIMSYVVVTSKGTIVAMLERFLNLLMRINNMSKFTYLMFKDH